jgi:hypothetical protein
MYPWLSEAEISDLCAPLKRAHAQARFMRGLGLTVREKPNGRPLVMRADIEALGIVPAAGQKSAGRCEPDRAALIAAFRA